MKNYIKQRRWNFTAVILGLAGFVFQFLSARRLETLQADNPGWIEGHYGQIGIILVALAAASYVLDHHNETKDR